MEIAGGFLFSFVTGEIYERGEVGGLEQDRWGLGGTGIFRKLQSTDTDTAIGRNGEGWCSLQAVTISTVWPQFSSCQILSLLIPTSGALVAGTIQSV